MRKILVRGTIANKPFSGGQSLIPLQYIAGLKRLGFDVLLFEDLSTEECWSERQNSCSFKESVQYDYFVRIMTAFSLAGHSSLLYDEGQEDWGASWEEVRRFARDADALIVFGGGLIAFADLLGAVMLR